VSKLKKKLFHLDCTLRDGGYYNQWDFDPVLIQEYLHAMAAISVDYVEVGFRFLDGDGFKGGCAYTTDEFIREFEVPNSLSLGVMINASEFVGQPRGMLDALEQVISPARDSPISLIRVACHFHELEAMLPGCDYLKDLGYTVGINLMQIGSRSRDEIEIAASRVSKHHVDVLYFADSMGEMSPIKTSEIIATLRLGWEGPLGIHTHDNMSKALANSLRAIEDGVTWIDSTVTGMGRGPGNAKTEYLAIEMADLRASDSNINPVLNLIEKYFVSLQRQYGWGTNAYYYLAGKYGIHPTYIQEMQGDARFSHEDIMAVIEHLRSVGGSAYNVNTLELGRHFYHSEPRGSWRPSELIANREVLILGSGPGVDRYRLPLENYIKVAEPFIIALNTQSAIDAELIDIRVACQPVRLLADCDKYLSLPQPLVTPVSMLPEAIKLRLKDKKLYDYGLSVAAGRIILDEMTCTIPTSLVFAYALAISISGRSSRILMAGFDGFDPGDPRNDEMDEIIDLFLAVPDTPKIIAITPTKFKLPSSSVYALRQ
jgi:4-hydroxy 2-oxovalerate aldolase